MALLDIKNINCFYGDVQVIYDVSLHIEEGEVISLIGANGAGKSTMLKTISGLMKTASGEILFAEPAHPGAPPREDRGEGYHPCARGQEAVQPHDREGKPRCGGP